MGSLVGRSSNLSSREVLENALHQAHREYSAQHAQSRKSYENACKYMPGGNTRTVLHTTPFPFTIAAGHGCTLKTIDGQEYTDFLGEYTAGIYGHNNPQIRKAIDKALDNGWNYGAQNVMEAQLAQIVCERFPAIEKVRFVNSGTEANMIAIGTALVHTGRKKILVFKKGYHGSTISGRSADGKPSLNLPHEFAVAPYNEIPATKAIIDALPKDSLAAILVEPVMGSGGCFAGKADFLELLRVEASRHNALLIFDEVMTSRLSYRGYGNKIDIRPDLMTIGKWVGGGMSFGAFGGREDIMNMFDPRLGKLEHAGTFNNNVVSMSAGIAGCTLLDEDRINKLNSRGERMRKAIEAQLTGWGIEGVVPEAPMPDDDLATPKTQNGNGYPNEQLDHDDDRPADGILDGSRKLPALDAPKMFVTGVGSMMAIHFSGPDKAMLQGLFYHHMLTKGIYLAQRGFIALNIEISDAHIDHFIESLNDFCKT